MRNKGKRTKTRYVTEIWHYDPSERSWTVRQTFTMGTRLESAIARADTAMAMLAPIDATWELRGYSHEAFATVRPEDRSCCVYRTYQTVRYVDSIADNIRDRGYAAI